MESETSSIVCVFRVKQYLFCTRCSLRYTSGSKELYIILEPLYS